MTAPRTLGILLIVGTLAALLPLPTAAASTCTATAAAPCAFSCLAGAPITVSATGTGVVTGVCSTAAADCIAQTGACVSTSAVSAISSGSGECVFVGDGAGECSAADDPRAAGRCGSEGAPALGVVAIVNPLTGENVAYVDDRSYLLANGAWIYLETNHEPGLQRGGDSAYVPDDTETCNESANPDTLVF